MEIFRCECGRGFDLEMQGKEKEIICPHCNARWMIRSAGRRYRIYEWKD